MIAVAGCLLVGCSGDESGPPNGGEDPGTLTGSWSLGRTQKSTTCQGIGDLAVGEVVNFVSCDGEFSLANSRGLWGKGSLTGTTIAFSGSEADTQLFGCKVTFASIGSGTRMGGRIEATMNTTVSFDSVTCGSRPDCTIAWAVSLRDLDKSCGCFERARFTPPARSKYVLPFPAGSRYRLSQGYCCEHGTHRNLLAVDFRMPLGDRVVAARAGTVRNVIQHFPDDGVGKDGHNLIQIEHADGTVASYAHLQQSSAVVAVGDRVEAGQKIACSGNSGLTDGPHLHFFVHRAWPPREGEDMPVNFGNASGRSDCRGGLVQGETYEARPF